jgi:hypothetical protein
MVSKDRKRKFRLPDTPAGSYPALVMRPFAAFGFALLLLLASSSVADGAVVTIDFSGKVTSLYDYYAAGTPSLNDGSLQVGTPFSGRIVVDTGTSPDSVTTGSDFEESLYTLPTALGSQFTLSVGSYSIVAAPAFSLDVRDNLPPDEFGDHLEFDLSSSSNVGSNILSMSASLRLEESSDTWLSDSSLAHVPFAAPPGISLQTRANLNWTLATPDQVGLAILSPGLELDSVRVTAPEPGAASLLAAAAAFALMLLRSPD